MRKITRDALAAFVEGVPFNRDNTSVTHCKDTGVTCLLLHGNKIARWNTFGYYATLEICDGGWQTVTTKERLNGITGVSITQKNWVWYLNGAEWSGEWTKVHPEMS